MKCAAPLEPGYSERAVDPLAEDFDTATAEAFRRRIEGRPGPEPWPLGYGALSASDSRRSADGTKNRLPVTALL